LEGVSGASPQGKKRNKQMLSVLDNIKRNQAATIT